MGEQLDRQSQTDLVLCAVGDVLIDRPDPDSALRRAGELTRAADVAIANSEGVYTRRPARAPGAGITVISDPKNAVGLRQAGFAVMTCANNHSVDGGHVGLADTLKTLLGLGIATAGAGKNIEAARRPAIVERQGRKVAVLAYSSVFVGGYEARENIPGLAPLRVHTVYASPNPNAWHPGEPAQIFTLPHPPDVEAFKQDIARAREQADLVVVCCHWGSTSVPAEIGSYERLLGHTAIDVGADLVLGCHQHSLRGVELYRGKPIFYGLGAFVTDLPNIEDRLPAAMLQKWREGRDPYAIGVRPGYPTFPFHPDYRMTMMARVAFGGREVASVGVIPCEIEPDGHPEPLAPADERHAKVLAFLRKITAEAGLDTVYEPAGGGSLAGFEACAVRGERT